MKKRLFWLALAGACIFCSCRTFDPALLRATDGRVDPPLVRLGLLSEEGVTITPGKQLSVNTYLYTLLEREIENISVMDGPVMGYIDLTLIHANYRPNYMWGVFSGAFFLGIPLLFGVPLAHVEARLEYDAKVYDLDRNVIWKRNYYASSNKYYTLYSGDYCSSESDDEIQTYVLLHRELLVQMKQDISKDAHKINRALGGV